MSPTIFREGDGRANFVPAVTGISVRGFWLVVDREELFLPFAQFPWFRRASSNAIMHIERLSADHLYWPDLDVDLDIESIRRPEDFPFVAGSGTWSSR